MLTTEGKIHIKRYFAQYVPSIAEAIAFGVGATAENAADVSLAVEVGRAEIKLITYDFVNNVVIYKAELPDDLAAKVYEVGLYSKYDDATAGNFGSRIITTFDSDTESWSNGTYTTTNTRIGADSLNLAPAANGTLTAAMSGLSIDFSGYSGSDQFVFAFNNGNTNASTVALRFKTDNSNYYTFSVSNPAAAYIVQNFDKSSATATGTPSWANITQVEVSVSSKSSGASSVDFEAVRVEDRDTANQDYILVARKVITPVTKLAGQPQDIEYTLNLTVT